MISIAAHVWIRQDDCDDFHPNLMIFTLVGSFLDRSNVERQRRCCCSRLLKEEEEERATAKQSSRVGKLQGHTHAERCLLHPQTHNTSRVPSPRALSELYYCKHRYINSSYHRSRTSFEQAAASATQASRATSLINLLTHHAQKRLITTQA
jgi:hypothetical protein